MSRPFAIMVLMLCAGACGKQAGIGLPDEVQTHDDGRATIQELFGRYMELRDAGWQLDIVASSQPEGTRYALPIIALRSPASGPATWIIAGIHGEEPAGPNAIAAAIDSIAELGRQRAVVVLPLCNPHGYVRNWRYLNVPAWSEDVDAQSVGDSSHLLVDPANGLARAGRASSAEADAITAYIVETMSSYPPLVSIDLHEDNLISEGYVYSQGVAGADDPLALDAVRALQDSGVPLKLDGQTRFEESIVDGIIGPVADSSIDELMSAQQIIVNGDVRAGPSAETVLVFETPAGELGIEQRIAAHVALLRRLTARLAP